MIAWADNSREFPGRRLAQAKTERPASTKDHVFPRKRRISSETDGTNQPPIILISPGRPGHPTKASKETVTELGSPSTRLSSIGDHRLLPVPYFTLASAMIANGRVLGLYCGFCIPSYSPTASAEVPEPLRPTKLQLETIHGPCIDRIPMARMRDNMIKTASMWDEEEFIADMFNMDSFTFKPGKMSWDPTGWVINESFKQKYNYFFV